jgi:hypothetical protein
LVDCQKGTVGGAGEYRTLIAIEDAGKYQIILISTVIAAQRTAGMKSLRHGYGVLQACGSAIRGADPV